MKHFKAAIFDLDGTLIDSMYVWKKVDIDFLAMHGIPVTKEYTEKMRGMFFRTAAEYTRTVYHLSESVEEIVDTWLSMAQREYAHHVQLKPFAKEYLEFLKQQDVKIGMATSSILTVSATLRKSAKTRATPTSIFTLPKSSV